MKKLNRQIMNAINVMLVMVASSTTQAADTTIKYWTWHPDAKAYESVIQRFEQMNPSIKVEITMMDAATLQQKVPLALTTGEDVDVVGVQPHMGMTIKDYLSDLDPLLTGLDKNWKVKYRQSDADLSKLTTAGVLKYLTIVRYGSMMGFYNVDIFNKYGLTPPKTIEDYKKISDILKAKAPDILPAVVNGKDAWTMNEMLYTIIGQKGDFYNQFVYKNASLNSEPVIEGLTNFKKLFDQGIMSKDVLDFDYARSAELFTSGKAATYFQGTWEGWLLSSKMRADKKVNINDVGAFYLPVIAKNGKPSLNSYIEVGTGISKNSKKQNEAAKFIAFLQYGEGADLLSKGMAGTFAKTNIKIDSGMYEGAKGKEGLELMNKLVENPAAYRYATQAVQSFTGFDTAVSNVLLSKSTPTEAAKELNEAWVNHSRKTDRKITK